MKEIYCDCSGLRKAGIVMSSYQGAQLIWGNPGGSGNWNGEGMGEEMGREWGREWGGGVSSRATWGQGGRRDSK